LLVNELHPSGDDIVPAVAKVQLLWKRKRQAILSNEFLPWILQEREHGFSKVLMTITDGELEVQNKNSNPHYLFEDSERIGISSHRGIV